MLKRIGISFIFLILTVSCATTDEGYPNGDGLDLSKTFERIDSNYTYKQLVSKDLEQMSDLLEAKTSEASSQRNLKEAAYIAFSRPNEDGSLEKYLSIVRDPLDDEKEWNNTIEGLVRQSVDSIKKADVSPAKQVTAGVILENVISELKPAFRKQYQTGGFETDVIEYIGHENLSYSKSARSERALNIMRNNLNPSEIAQKLLNEKKASFEKNK